MCISRRHLIKVLDIQGVMNMRPALLGRKSISTGIALRQRVQQCLRLLQVGGVKSLGDPAIDGCQEVIGLSPLALLQPEASKAYRDPQFWRLGLLPVAHIDGLMEWKRKPPIQTRVNQSGIVPSSVFPRSRQAYTSRSKPRHHDFRGVGCPPVQHAG
jgi:hypothetical protein